MVIRSLFSACQSRNKISSSPGALSSLHVAVVILQTKQISECRTAGFAEQASGFKKLGSDIFKTTRAAETRALVMLSTWLLCPGLEFS